MGFKIYLPLVSVLFLATASSGPRDAFAQTARMTVGIGGINPGTSLSFIAKKENLFAKQGLDVNLVNTTTPSAVQAIISGTMHSTMSFGGPAFPRATLEGAPAVVLISSWVSVFPYRVVAHKDIGSPRELKGKTGQIGAAFGTTPHDALELGLARLGLNPEKDVKLVQMARPDWANVLAQLERGDVHFAPLPPPYDRVAEKRGFRVLFSLPDLGIHWSQYGEWMLKSYLNNNRDTALRLVRVVAESMKIFFEQKEKTLGYLSEFMGTNREDTEYAYQLFLKWADRNPKPKVESARNLLEVIKKTTPKAATADPASFIDTSLVDQLAKEGYFK
jgi:ABC-type nitrate/sulfonate/bicarbonate transport system substrate-binding protein